VFYNIKIKTNNKSSISNNGFARRSVKIAHACNIYSHYSDGCRRGLFSTLRETVEDMLKHDLSKFFSTYIDFRSSEVRLIRGCFSALLPVYLTVLGEKAREKHHRETNKFTFKHEIVSNFDRIRRIKFIN